MAHRRQLSDLRSGVRDVLDEATVAFWTAATLDRYINRAKDRVWTEVRRLQADYFDIQRVSTDGTVTILDDSYATSSFAIVAGTRNYTLPPDFVSMRLIEVTTSGFESVRFVHRDLAHPEMRSWREIVDQMTPNQFYFDLIGERTMTIAPLSDTALDLRLTYVRVIGDLGVAHPISSITRSGTTATVTTLFDHGLSTGDSVTVAGAGESGYNIAATITVATSTTWTYTVAGSPATPATGTITYTTAADRLEMPWPLANAVEAYAAAYALKQDRNTPLAAVWESTGRQFIIEAMGAHARQSQDVEVVPGAMHEWTGW